MESRKRTYSQRSKAVTEQGKDEETTESGNLKLVLKAPPSSKLKTKSKFELLENCLESPEGEVIENLLLVSEFSHPRLLKDWEKNFELLKQLWQKYHDNSAVCGVLINILMKLLPVVPSISPDQLDYITSMNSSDCKEVQSLVLKLWAQIGDILPIELKTRCIEKAINVIYDPCHMLRMECLNLIGQLNSVISNEDSLLLLVAEFCNDCDSRVRRVAVQALLTMFNRGIKLGLDVYHKSCDLLQDDDDNVRYVALQLVHALGTKLQESDMTVPLAQDPSITLPIEDDCFVKTCDMVTDRSVAVRSLATTLLGQFRNVSERFLLQTLDKKLMSHLRVVKSEHQRARDEAVGVSRDWDTGQRWGGGVPRLDLNPSELTLLRSGSCGAFVHSLEDEFLEVRSAAVVSMGQLCMLSSSFGSLSLDYLVDMFNDEIQSVRLLAINCLRKVSTTIHFREDQLETVLGVLQESSQEVREALHDLLATCHITTVSGLRMTVHSLLDNLKKYPSDQQSIWSCMKCLGNKQAHLVCSLVPELLSSHPFFLTKEPDINDGAYVSILILVFNATGLSPTMISLFPPHIFHHYTYLHDTLPDLIPLVKALTVLKTCKLPEKKASSPEVFMEQILSRVGKPLHQSHDSSVAMLTLKQCITDLNQFCKVEPSLSGCVRFSSQLLQCQLLLIKIQRAVSCAVIATAGPNDVASDIRELLLLSYRLQWTYTNHDSQLLLSLRLLRVLAHCALLLLAIKLDWTTDHKDKFEHLRSSLLSRIENAERLCEGHSLTLPASIQALVSRLLPLDTNQLLPLLQKAVQTFNLHELDPTQLIKIKQCVAEITSPDTADDVIHKFLSSLALSIPMTAIIHNLSDPSSLAAKVKIPDGRIVVITPKDSELRPSDPTTHKLDMNLILSHGNWTDSSSLEVQLVRHYTADIPSDSKSLEILNKLCRKGGVARVSAIDCAGDCVGEVVISDSVRVRTHPQETLTRGFNVFGP